MSATSPIRRLVFALLLIAGAATPASAAPRDELLRLVPEDAGFCLVVSDLRGLAKSPFLERFQASPLGKGLAKSPEWAKLLQAEKQVKANLGADFAQLRDDILGDTVVFVYRPGPPEKLDQEQGLFLTWARDPQLLKGLADKLNELQTKSGELKKLEEREHQGVKYFCRIETKKEKEPFYYWLNGSVLAATGQEAMLKQVIERSKLAKSEKEAPPVARRFRELLSESNKKADNWGTAALLINPRAFDAQLNHSAKSATGIEASRLKSFLRYWKALESAGLFLRVDSNIEMSLALRSQLKELPAPALKFFGEGAQTAKLWDVFPEDAILASAGRFDIEAFIDLLGDFMAEDVRKSLNESFEKNSWPALGKFYKEVLPRLGPDVGFCVTAPPANDKQWFPNVVAAVQVRADDSDKQIEKTLSNSMQLFGLLAVFDHNSKNKEKISLDSVEQDKVTVRFLTGDKAFPPGLQPAFALKSGHLLLASSPESIRLFNPVAKNNKAADEVPLVRMSFKSLRTYIGDRRAVLVDHIAEKEKIDKAEVSRRLDNLRNALQLFDRADLVQRTVPGQVTWTIRLQPAK